VQLQRYRGKDEKYNPTGVYRHTFDIPPAWLDGTQEPAPTVPTCIVLIQEIVFMQSRVISDIVFLS